MRHTQRLLAVLLYLSLLDARSAAAQERSPWFGGASLGPVMQDQHGNDFLQQSGFVVHARAGRRIGTSLAAVAVLTHTSIPGKYDVAVPLPAVSLLGRVPCPDGDPLPCGPDPFTGPVKAVIAGAGVEASAGSAGARVFASLSPGIYWLYERSPAASPASPGVGLGAGGSVRLMEPLWLVLDLGYHQIFSSGPAPRWLVPMGLGIQVRE